MKTSALVVWIVIDAVSAFRFNGNTKILIVQAFCGFVQSIVMGGLHK
ncbi:MAG: hypothetical protein JEZ00_12055 [Anaerolineaceae bacterium]|nr:hypothetical protein [Anaerolineaceae bacterium]